MLNNSKFKYDIKGLIDIKMQFLLYINFLNIQISHVKLIYYQSFLSNNLLFCYQKNEMNNFKFKFSAFSRTFSPFRYDHVPGIADALQSHWWTPLFDVRWQSVLLWQLLSTGTLIAKNFNSQIYCFIILHSKIPGI